MRLIWLCIEDEVTVDEDNVDNYNLEEENENENTKPGAYSMYVNNTELRTLTLKFTKIVEAIM